MKSVAWASDSRTFFYTVDDETKRAHRVMRHRLGAADGDALLYQEDDERFGVAVWRMIAERKQDHEYDVSHRGGDFLIRTNDRGRNFRVVRAPVDSPGLSSWKELVPHREGVMIEGLDVFESFYVLLERETGLPYIRVSSFADDTSHRIGMEEPVYAVYPGNNEEFSASVYRFHYESLTTPDSVFDYDVTSTGRTLVKQLKVLGGYDPAAYESERLWATAQDGTQVPISVVYKKGMRRDGSSPMLLAGYGSYGYPYPTGFSHARVSLLNRGFTFAIAHIRGGGELRKPWHDQGRMEHKMNTFTDFIAVAEHLISKGYTSSDRLAIRGGSAGGLLMGAVSNLRPDLFRAVVSLVPFVDVLNTMLDDSLPLTVGEYEEWGNPNERDAYFRIEAYCPYTNITAQPYPTMLIRTSLNDIQVMYWEPAKYVAKLRAHKTDGNPLLFKINMDAGHGGASGRYDYLKETALDYAFVLTQLQ